MTFVLTSDPKNLFSNASLITFKQYDKQQQLVTVQCVHTTERTYIYVSQKMCHSIVMTISSNLNQFSKFFHC